MKYIRTGAEGGIVPPGKIWIDRSALLSSIPNSINVDGLNPRVIIYSEGSNIHHFSGIEVDLESTGFTDIVYRRANETYTVPSGSVAQYRYRTSEINGDAEYLYFGDAGAGEVINPQSLWGDNRVTSSYTVYVSPSCE